MLFKVKSRTIVKQGKEVPRVAWMNLNGIYPVFDVMKYRVKMENGLHKIDTLFLVCELDSGRMEWTDASLLLYCGE